MMAAEAVAGATLGYVVQKLLDEVLKSFQLLKNRSTNVRKLQELLDRSQPAVNELCSSVQQETHPAHKWLSKLRDQLEMCHDFINASSKVRTVWWASLKLLRTSKKSLELYQRIYTLLQEASLQQWASGMSFQTTFIENDAKNLAEMREAQERSEQLFRQIAKLPPTAEIRQAISKLQQIGSSSSTIQTTTLRTGDTDIVSSSSSEIWDGSATGKLIADSAFDIPEPKVTFGGEAVAEEVISHLLSSNYKEWTALHGMGGVGKSCTASKVCHDSRIKRHFTGGIISLTVSKDQPGLDNLYRQLVWKIEDDKGLFRLPKEVGAAKSYLQGKLDRERVLLVLDDVWQKDVLEHLDVLPENKECVILVTTRDQKVLGRRIRLCKMFDIPPLSVEHSWQLFSYHAFRSWQGIVPPEVEAVAKEVAKECGGLPLALEVIGSTMADKELVPAERTLGQSTLRIWEIALERLRNANVGNNEYDALYSKLQLSVDSLGKQDPRLRDCFIYFAAFAEDEHVDIDMLVRMWIAEGLVQDDVHSSLSAEEKGRILLAFLVAKSMIQLLDYSCCKIHDVLRDVARQNMVRDWSTYSAKTCLYAAGMHRSELPTEWIDSATSSSAERLSLQNNDLRQFPGPEQFHTPNLQVLLLSQNKSLRSLSVGFFQNLSNLRVLDLSHCGIETFPGELLQKLKSLVLLDLSFCKELQEVSDEIGGLLCLEFLSFAYCDSLRKLPRVNNLTKLKEYHTSVPREVAEMDVEGLLCPKFLSFFGCKNLRKLPRVNKLTKLKEYRTSVPREVAEMDVPDLSQKDCAQRKISYTFPPSLRILKLYFERASYDVRGSFENPAYCLFDMSSLCSLQQLTLEGDANPYPTGIEDLHHLKVLRIFGGYRNSPLPALDRLPSLEYLGLFNVDTDIELSGYEGAFPSLQKFDIHYLGLLARGEKATEEMLVFHEGMMPKIESLSIEMDPEVGVHFPASMARLSNLQRIRLWTWNVQIRDEDLELVFKQPDCFPHLQNLTVEERVDDAQKASIGSLVDRLPKHMIERSNRGNLTIKHDVVSE